jgi:hypothetical protein
MNSLLRPRAAATASPVHAQHPTGFFGREEMRCRQTCRTVLDYTYKARYVHVFFGWRGREGGEREGGTGRAEGQGGDGRAEGCAIPTFCPARSRFVHQAHTVQSCLFPPLLVKSVWMLQRQATQCPSTCSRRWLYGLVGDGYWYGWMVVERQTDVVSVHRTRR